MSELAPSRTETIDEPDLDIVAYIEVVWRRKWIFGGIVTLVLVGAFVRTMYFLPEMYGSAATILPLKAVDGGALGMLRQVGGAAGALAGLGLGGAGGDAERLVSVLRTRSLAESVARRHALFERLVRKDLNKLRRKGGATFGPTDMDRIPLELVAAHPAGLNADLLASPGAAVLELEDDAVRRAVGALPGWAGTLDALDAGAVRDAWYVITQNRLRGFRDGVGVDWDRKQSVIKVSVMFEGDPEMAAALANAYIEELRAYLRENTSTEARRNRVFIENRFREAETDLAAAEGDLEAFEQEHELVSLPEQTAYAVTRLGELEARLAAKQIERDVLAQAKVSPGSAPLAALEVEIRGIDGMLSEALRGRGSAVGTMALADLPTVKRELFELMRAKAVQETLFKLLAEQYEVAKIDEIREEVAFETLDLAMPATERASPRRKVDMVIGLAIGCVLAALCVAAVEMLASRRAAALAASHPGA
ncbi:hypothetical protein HOK31_25225 [Candidatus Poribacteria bacterium]|nr:hypothetical protein [Candidatus Poribacteria bacterium]